jgi:hypothetical protein
VRAEGIAAAARAEITTHNPTAKVDGSPPTKAIAATTEPIPTVPANSGTSRLLRERMSNHNSTPNSGTAAANGTQNQPLDEPIAVTTANVAITVNSTAAIRAATRVRSIQRFRLRSTNTTFNGVRATKPSIAASPNASPGHDHATNNPTTTGSAVKLHPPCSEGTAT